MFMRRLMLCLGTIACSFLTLGIMHSAWWLILLAPMVPFFVFMGKRWHPVINPEPHIPYPRPGMDKLIMALGNVPQSNSEPKKDYIF